MHSAKALIFCNNPIKANSLHNRKEFKKYLTIEKISNLMLHSNYNLTRKPEQPFLTNILSINFKRPNLEWNCTKTINLTFKILFCHLFCSRYATKNSYATMRNVDRFNIWRYFCHIRFQCCTFIKKSNIFITIFSSNPSGRSVCILSKIEYSICI